MRKTLKGVALTAVSVLCIGVSSASAATEVVTENDVARQPENTPPTNNWVIYTRTAPPASNAVFRTGPGSPPLGAGSLELTTATGADKVTAFNYDHVGTALSDVNALGYSTYRSAGSLQQVAALNLQVDVNGADPGGFTTLVFEPVYNTDQGAVVSGQWQDWDAYNGGDAIWWSSNPIPSAPDRDTFVTWDTIVANNPNAVVVGGYGVNQGSGNPALTTATDALTFNDTTYDFERVPLSKDDCKKGGWESYGTFKNQGDCVSSVASKNK
jgi:hypothetical protein